MQLFYAPNITTPLYTLSEQESLHATRVLRLGIGAQMHLTDGRGTMYLAEVVEVGKRCTVRIIEETPEFERRPFRLTLACAPTKNSERWEWFVEKAVETGVDCIVPLLCTHSERRNINTERTERVITEAMKQSLKAYRPTLAPMTKFADFINGEAAATKLIAHCRDTERHFIGDVLKNSQLSPRLFANRSTSDKAGSSMIRPRLQLGLNSQFSTLYSQFIILIGPEGDFSVEEIEQAVAGGFIPVSLGTARLRTETAALAAVTITNYELGNIPYTPIPYTHE